MPRSRRRHHSRSRSRSKSHSHDRDRDAKRRKIESLDSPGHKRSVSCERQNSTPDEDMKTEQNEVLEDSKAEGLECQTSSVAGADPEKENEFGGEKNTELQQEGFEVEAMKTEQNEALEDSKTEGLEVTELVTSVSCADPGKEKESGGKKNTELEQEIFEVESVDDLTESTPKTSVDDKNTITPKKVMSPKNLQKKLESEKKRQQKQLEREERERKKNEERERARLEKLKQKQEKDEQRQKERMEKNEQKAKERELKEGQKRKEREEKEQKRKEREERDEQKRKEREQEKLKKQQELEEKNREKQKQEEQKQKAATAFVNFFKKADSSGVASEDKKSEEGRTSIFMPFEVKSGMKLAPIKRAYMTDGDKEIFDRLVQKQDLNASYLSELKAGKLVGKAGRTWPYEDGSDDCIIIEDDFGESICEDKPKTQKMKAKYLKFQENRRPAYYGTWRKKSQIIKPRKPLVEDKAFFDYEVDSDDDWEEEEQGESLNGSDDEDNEGEVENDDYEVDNEFFVPHGHLSDDEIDDETSGRLSPESHKCKLKLLKDEFDQDMQTKTNKIKPRFFGCVWYNKVGRNVDEAIDRHLRPLALITNGQIVVNERNTSVLPTVVKKAFKKLQDDLMPTFLKVIHRNVHKKRAVIEEFLSYLENNEQSVDITKTHLAKNLKEFAQWKKCSEEGPLLNKFCWMVNDDIAEKYNIQ